MSTAEYADGPAPGQYSVDPENQLKPGDTLIERGGAASAEEAAMHIIEIPEDDE